jgi:hypothetical protein
MAPASELLAEEDLGGDGAQRRVLPGGRLLQVGQAHLGGLVVVVAHVLEEADVDGAGARMALGRCVTKVADRAAEEQQATPSRSTVMPPAGAVVTAVVVLVDRRMGTSTSASGPSSP